MGRPYDLKLLRRLAPFAGPYKWLLTGAILLVVFITLLDLSLPYVTKIAIDRYILPVAATDSGPSDTAQPSSRTRFLKVDPNEAPTRALISRHRALFERRGDDITIPVDRLPELSPREIVILRQSDVDGLEKTAMVFVVIILLHFVLNFIQMMLMETSGQMIMHDLRTRLFRHIQSLSVAYFSRHPVGRLVTRTTNDIQNMHELFTSVIVFVFKDLFLLAGITIVLLNINWKLALVSFAVLPPVAYASYRFSTHARDAFRLLRVKIAEINTRMTETIGGMTVIQLFGQQDENGGRFRRLNHETYLAGMRQIRIFAVFMPVIECLGVIALALVIFYGGSGVLAGRISLGALVAFISYVKMFFRPIRDIAEKYNILQNALASAERIFQILDSRDQLPPPDKKHCSAFGADQKIRDISFQNVSFSYVDGEPVLRDITFAIRAGETLAVVGPTGSGKTSLIQLITRFYDPTGGSIAINGVNVQDIDPFVLRSKIAIVPQDPFLFSVSVRDNIIPGGPPGSSDALAHILKASNCEALVRRLPRGADTVLAEGGSSISSGERQLLSIARAFAHRPDLIIFDEATSYVDSETERTIQRALANLMKNRTAIIVAHRLSSARRADRIIVLNRGRIIESGSHAALMRQKGFYFRLGRLSG